MKNARKMLGVITLVAVIGFSFAALSLTGCDNDTTTSPSAVPPATPGTSWKSAIQLTEGVWADGNTSSASNNEQLFKFTATAETQYIHFSPDVLKNVYIQLYDSDGTTVGDITNLYGSSLYISRTVTIGSEYFIRVIPYDGSGAYQIAFSKSRIPPIVTLPTANITALTEGVWADGSISTDGGAQWFKFTATATYQYIHFNPGTLNNVYVQLYDSTGTRVGDRTNLNSSSLYFSRTVTTDGVYYIKVIPYDGSGAYQIAFSKSSTPPAITLPTANVTTLTADVWANGSISTSGAQWFKFSATAATQYIHFNPDTLNYVYVQLYDSTGATVGNRTYLYSSSPNTSRTVTTGSVYYIMVTPSSSGYSGAYQIAFNTSTTISLPTVNATALTEGVWADGSISTGGGSQWFKFTATAETQYIHFKSGALSYVYVYLYDNTGTVVGSGTYLYSYASISVTTASEYSIKVMPSSSSESGAYQITFNSSSTAPGITLPTANVTTLTAGVWANGSISTSGGVQWFKFTATASSSQYIHFKPGTLDDVYIEVYDSTGATVGYRANLWDTSLYTSRSVTNGVEYYISVTPYANPGAYQIAFNTTSTPPTP